MQQPLERYGVVVLLFLVALVAVAVFWEDGTSTKVANDTLATVEPQGEPQVIDEPERRPVSETSRAGANRAVPEIALGPEDQGVDQRGRTTTYGVTPIGGGVAAPAGVEQSESGSAGLSRPGVRGGGDAIAHPSGAGPSGQDSLAKDLERVDGGSKPTVETNVAPPVTPPAGASREYTVRSGESLWRIAERELGNGTRCKEIAALNGLSNSDHIIEGMKLKLPAKDGAVPATSVAGPTKPQQNDAAPAKPAPAATLPVRRGTGDTTERLALVTGTRRYVVKSGDSLGLIAQRELGSAKRAAEIKQLNGMSSDVVKLGTALVLPGGSAVSDGPVVAVATPKPAARRETARPPGRNVAPKERRATSGEFTVR